MGNPVSHKAVRSRELMAVKRFVLRYRRLLVPLLYMVTSWGANAVAFLMRFDGQVPDRMWAAHFSVLPWLIGARLCGFAAFGQFRGLWRYASIYDLWNIVAAVVTSSLGFYVIQRLIRAQSGYPRSVMIIDALVLILALGGLRIARRVAHEMRRGPRGKKVLVVGAGNAGEMIVRDMHHNPDYDYLPIGFVDDDPGKQGEQIHGVRVLGTRADLRRIIEKVKPDDVLIAMPTVPRAVVQEVVRSLQHEKVNIITLPSLSEIVSGHVSVSQIRKLAIEDLLARPPVGLDPAQVKHLIQGRRVMVTGAGGSIGSELCRQIAALEPATLLLFERYENSLFAVANEVHDRWPGLEARPLIGDITDSGRVNEVFSQFRPEVVFHAAAHKHVPLMELSPCEAVKNNVFGTQQLVDAAVMHGAGRFILISTDKAVNPTSAMGVSKRVAEMIVQAKNGSSGTAFAAVRFGNVLGSNGSVIPRFVDQIKAGGPVTVTHREMRRFFMLIPEAVQLVLHAAAMARGGEVFVLDMGEQISVLDMARTLIRLAGFVPDVDIPITFTGLRPGEKLYEELVGMQEAAGPSGTEKVSTIQRNHVVDPEALDRQLADLRRCATSGNVEELRRVLGELVPTYAPDVVRDRPARDAALRRTIDPIGAAE